MRKCEACRREFPDAHESAQTVRGTWVCADTYACRDALRERVSNLEGTKHTLEVALVAGNRVSTVALEALESIGKNTCGREPLAAAYARGVLEELANTG